MEHNPLPPALEPSSILNKIQKSGWAILLSLAAVSLIYGSPLFAMGVAAGGALGLGNFRGMDIYFDLVFRPGNTKLKWWHHALYAARFLALLAAVAGAIAWGGLPVVSVVIGLSTPVMGIVFYGALALIKGEAAARA